MEPPLTSYPDFKRGFRAGAIAGLSFSVIFFSFGVDAMQKNVPAPMIPLFSLFIFAAPAQFAVVDMATPLTPLWQIIAVGVMVNVRFFVWGLALSPFVRHVPLKRLLFWSWFLAASTFLLPLLDRKSNPHSDLFRFFQGVVSSALPITIAGTVLGMALQGTLPPMVAYACSLFFPVYFGLLLVGDTRGKMEVASIAGAFLLSPAIEKALPGWGVMGAAMISATVSLGGFRWIRKAG